MHYLIIRSSIYPVQIWSGRMLLPQITSGICRTSIDSHIRLVDIRIGEILVDLGETSMISRVGSRGTIHDNDQLEKVIAKRLQLVLLVLGKLHVFPVQPGGC